MIEQLVPPWARGAEALGDPPGAAPHPAELRFLPPGAIQGRRREFATGRACARSALAALGAPASGPLPRGAHGAPVWPAGTLGSITHCDGYRAAVAARTADGLALGIDAERPRPLSERATTAIATPEELHQLRTLQRTSRGVLPWATLLFSTKEAVYKAWHPHARRPLSFRDAEVRIEPCDEARGVLTVRPTRLALPALDGGYRFADGLLVTVVHQSLTRALSSALPRTPSDPRALPSPVPERAAAR
ncbi:4'-phosphopantetheinyl transferase superfamily protein [Streptomyces sp. BPTC-684]|uniref:4'-phosphopantetheinyl transferase family protein n=1 Tax=Streptomyces sp. BPTC-684 TaxID=3043734 RepID=UPI0024B0F215|nr:4'-phosphopantetheinyl transferase superfamily protein [Streptomyces sp. BPTC-684]WHM40060.1 4'-phosphopantetheinyl transferase superfamily protein [Streptomyces sp. BPTC-684]